MGMTQESTNELELIGLEKGQCLFTRTLKDLSVKFDQSARDMMKKNGASDADFKAIENASKDIYDSADWDGCTRPQTPCTERPPLKKGCEIGSCESGAWTITCGEFKCKFEGSVLKNTRVGCQAGGAISFSSDR